MFIRIISLTLITSLVFSDVVRAMEPGDSERIRSQRRLSIKVMGNTEDEERVQHLLQHQQKIEEEERQCLELLEVLERQKTNHDLRQEELRKEETQIREALTKIAFQKEKLLSEKQRQEKDEHQWLESRQQEENKIRQEEENYQRQVEEARLNREDENHRHQQEFESQKIAFQRQDEDLFKKQEVAQEALQKIELLEKELQEEQDRNAQLKTDENASANTKEETIQKLSQRQGELKQEKKDTQEVLRRLREEQEKFRHKKDAAKEKEREWQAQRLVAERQLTEEALIHHHLVEDSSIRREEEGYRHQQALENQIEALRRQEEELHEAQHGAQEKLRNLSLQQEILEGEKTKWAEDSRTAQQKLDACRLEKERSSTSFPSSSGPTPSVLSSSPPSTLSSDLSKSSKTTSSPSSSPEEESLISKSLLSKRTKKAFSPNNETTPLLPKGDLSLQDINTWFLIERTNEEQIPCLSKKQTLLAFVIPSEESDSVSYLEEQPIDEETILIQKAQLLFSKIEGTSLEDFGKYYMGHVIDKRYRLKDYGGLIAAGIMAAGTAAATSPIVEWSLYNKYTSKWIGGGALDEVILGHYINITTALIALTDATSFMLAATSPSTRTFTIPKSKREKAVDWILVPPAGIPGIFLLLLGFQVQQEHKKATGTSGWWNEYDQYFYFSSLGFFPYLFAKTFNGMRLAVSKMFHHSIPEHVREQVLALRQLEARVDYLSDHQVHDLYAFLRSPLFNHNTLKLKEWAKYFFKGEMSDVYTVEGLLTYLCITKYAQETMKEESEELQKLGYKNIKSRIIGALGTPAGFAVIAISLYGTFEAFMDPKIALGSSLTGATLGFLPGAILESHNLQESLYTLNKGIVPYLKGGKRYFVNTLKDPYSWAKGAGRVFSFTQNLLTNIFPILFSLAILIPEALKVDETTQEIITGVMLFLAVPLVLSELANGTIDIQGHVMKIAYSVQDIAYCCRKSTSSASREKRIIKGWLQETITTTLQFTPKHIEKLDDLAQHLEGKN